MAVRTFLSCTKILKNPFGKQKILDPKTLGEHLLNRRLELGLLQREAAELLSVSEDTITYWENGRAHPQVKYYPAIIAFLDYYPFEHETESLAGKLKQIRFCKGLNFTQCAQRLSVSFDAAKRWEQGKPVADPKNKLLIERVWQELPNRFVQHPS